MILGCEPGFKVLENPECLPGLNPSVLLKACGQASFEWPGLPWSPVLAGGDRARSPDLNPIQARQAASLGPEALAAGPKH